MAPPPNAPRPLRALAVVGLVLVALYAGVFLGSSHTPRLGLDLRGGTSVILEPKAGGGAKVTKASISKAVDIIQKRVNGLGVSEAEVTTQGGRNIVISVPGKGRKEVVDLVGSTAQLRFREVVNTAPAAAAPQPSATPTPTGSASPRPSPAPSLGPAPSASPTSNGRALSGALLPAATSSPAASPSPRASTPPSPQPTPATNPGADAAAQAQFATFNCDAAAKNKQGGSLDDPAKPLVTCNEDGSTKYLLAPAKVIGTDVRTASADLDQRLGNEWQVNVRFTGKGQKKFTSLTEATVGKQVAIVLDGLVISDPRINGVIPGDAQITGQFNEKSAKDLANVLKYGALPLTFETQQAETISPTLGGDQLRAGLLAGAIGLGLVILYSLLYYRGLGLVTVASLALSGLVIYAATVLLGRAINYTLTLAGIAGFIVAVGITADSFVVYFERVRDEVRDGRSMRSGVERGWVRARRTILSADTVSLLAAAILYFLTTAGVRGFAFTLGLSTIVDIFVVFLFTKPLLSLLSGTKAFSGGGWFSGLGRARASVLTDPEPVTVRRRTTSPKEA
ncbi:MAG: protein translocase subunit SecD [Mycobacteriales bacterium]